MIHICIPSVNITCHSASGWPGRSRSLCLCLFTFIVFLLVGFRVVGALFLAIVGDLEFDLDPAPKVLRCIWKKEDEDLCASVRVVYTHHGILCRPVLTLPSLLLFLSLLLVQSPCRHRLRPPIRPLQPSLSGSDSLVRW